MINKLIIDSLKPLGFPVAFQKYSGNESTYITFFEYLQKGEAFSENEEEGTGHYIQVDVWSKEDYMNLVKAVKEKLINAGFKRKDEHDLYESDTGIYHKCIRFFYLEQN